MMWWWIVLPLLFVIGLISNAYRDMKKMDKRVAKFIAERQTPPPADPPKDDTPP